MDSLAGIEHTLQSIDRLLNSMGSAAPGSSPEAPAAATVSQETTAPAIPSPQSPPNPTHLGHGPANQQNAANWPATLAKWDRWAGDREQSPDRPSTAEPVTADKSNAILDAIKELAEDVQEIRDRLDEGEADAAPGIGKDGKFRPGGPKPLGTGGSATRTRERAPMERPWMDAVNAVRRG